MSFYQYRNASDGYLIHYCSPTSPELAAATGGNHRSARHFLR